LPESKSSKNGQKSEHKGKKDTPSYPYSGKGVSFCHLFLKFSRSEEIIYIMSNLSETAMEILSKYFKSLQLFI